MGSADDASADRVSGLWLACVTDGNNRSLIRFSGTLDGRLTEARLCITLRVFHFWLGIQTLDAERHMPIYEYECQACAHRFEEWQKMSDKPVKVCPRCKARRVEKLISHTSFQLKGGGWGSDLYASAKPSSPATSEGGTSGSTKPSAASSGDSSSATTQTSATKSKASKGGAKAAA
jgi:putative FmdB family regulatory protein